MTVSCAEGDTGYVYAGEARLRAAPARRGDDACGSVQDRDERLGNPDRAFSFRALPQRRCRASRGSNSSSGHSIGVHPRALLDFERLPEALRERIRERSAGYGSPEAFFVEKLVEGVATIAAAFHPKPVIVRLSDFKSDEYANLVGGGALRARGSEPDARGFAGRHVTCRMTSARASSWECRAMRRGARRDGLHQRRADDPVRAHARRGPRGRGSARPQRPGARTERSQDHHDVRGAVERDPRRESFSSTSTASPSARTTSPR